MPMRTKASFTRDEMLGTYPAVAKAFDELLENDNGHYNSYKILYCGKYKDKKGEPRRIELGRVLDILSGNGYKIQITVTKK